VLVPSADAGAGACSALAFDLRVCLASLIERKGADDAPLTITIAAGRYTLGPPGGLLVFQRKNVTIRGAAALTPGGEPQTHVALDARLARDVPELLRAFVQVVDSSGIAISDLSLDGADLRFHGFAVCPLGGDDANPTRDITIERVWARGFTDFYAIVGQPIGHNYLHGEATVDAAMTRIDGFTGTTDQPGDPRQYCEGDLHRVTFAHNVVLMKSVAFYGAPLLVRQTREYTGLRSPTLVTGDGPLAKKSDWVDVLRGAAARNSGFRVRDNRFIVDLDPSFPDYETQRDAFLHSAIKVQGMSDVAIEGNVIDSRAHADSFKAGAGINVAFDMFDVALRDNRLLFPAAYQHPSHAVEVELGFIPHVYFGTGYISFTETATRRVPFLTPDGQAQVGKLVPYGIAGLAGPALDVRIVRNELENGYVSIDPCCANTLEHGGKVLGWGDLTDYCRDMDAHQTPGDPKLDGLVIQSNVFRFGGPKPKSTLGGTYPLGPQPPWVVRANETLAKEHPDAPFPEAEYCRQRLSIVQQDNRVE
jgi:hypothetical protein